jgi:hypothetical protein
MVDHTWKLVTRTGLTIVVQPAGSDDGAILNE